VSRGERELCAQCLGVDLERLVAVSESGGLVLGERMIIAVITVLSRPQIPPYIPYIICILLHAVISP